MSVEGEDGETHEKERATFAPVDKETLQALGNDFKRNYDGISREFWQQPEIGVAMVKMTDESGKQNGFGENETKILRSVAIMAAMSVYESLRRQVEERKIGQHLEESSPEAL